MNKHRSPSHPAHECWNDRGRGLLGSRMARSSFYCIIENNPEAIAEVQDIINGSNREQLGLMLMSKNELLRKVILDDLSGQMKLRNRLIIYENR